MKRLISLLLTLLLCMGLFGCGQKKPAGETEAEKITVPVVGELYTFGTYQREEIQWQVLAVEEDRALLVSRYALDAQVYHVEWEDVTWETCTLRSWMNEEFLNEAFTAAEQKRILTTTVAAEGNPTYQTDPGNDTQDKIFLLSLQEVLTYMPREEDRKCGVTAYAKEQEVWVNSDGYCDWWLRNPGNFGDNALVIYNSGSFSEEGDDVIYCDRGIRPALWLSVKS